ncbi:DNA polymerase IV [Lactobacillus sp. PV034]|uniref:DNA polymerase IV n=1 Tax=Lactobacillus sp. PV034 TaxID=2594495 RepID=UPI00223F4FB3|nr:DNA polymerase IV [Lactobacillus sp. PV034]QNQ81461.1 DNA polymerase IV [Lactobacillus sp. PV034]
MKELLPRNNTKRKIIHLDMDAFYASVEMRDNPALAKKALIVGQDPRKANGHGVVATANYVARQYGVHSAMPTMKALRLVPKDKIAFVRPNFEKYRAVSAQIHELMYELTDVVESVALDEAYLDVTKNKLGVYSAVTLATRLQEKIFKKTGLTSSFGVSYNKFLAKMGSEFAKPFGRTIILPEEAEDFLAQQPIEAFPGIGKKTQEQLHSMGIFTGADLQNLDVKFLIERFKRMGYFIAQHAQGIDLRPVNSTRQRKSIGTERTFEPNIFDENIALTTLRKYSENLSKKLKEKNFLAQTLVIKVRNNNFETVTKRSKLTKPTNDAIEIFQTAKELFKSVDNFLTQGIRLLGLSTTDLQTNQYEEISLDLFTTE